MTSDPADDAVACLGRISPDGGDAVRVSARSISGQPSIVAELRVAEGDTVKHGQVLAVLDSRPQLEAAWRAADARHEVAMRRLEQVKAGVKPADLAAQNAEIAKLEAELANAESERQRFSIAARRRADRHLRARLQAAGRRRQGPAAASVARAAQQPGRGAQRRRGAGRGRSRLGRMSAGVARTEFEQTEIRSPFSGRVVEIHAWPGEEVTGAGILELARTDRMYVVAEVSERDIARAGPPGPGRDVTRRGPHERRCTARSTAGQQGGQERRAARRSTAMSDSRVVETWIRLTSRKGPPT